MEEGSCENIGDGGEEGVKDEDGDGEKGEKRREKARK